MTSSSYDKDWGNIVFQELLKTSISMHHSGAVVTIKAYYAMEGIASF